MVQVKCDNCEQRQVIVGNQEYVRIGDDCWIEIEIKFNPSDQNK
ncbi:MAG: hypothetical protein WBX29_11775 [Nitrososphaeraceae archaeon]